jgi:hypothetical protein
MAHNMDGRIQVRNQILTLAASILAATVASGSTADASPSAECGSTNWAGASTTGSVTAAGDCRQQAELSMPTNQSETVTHPSIVIDCGAVGIAATADQWVPACGKPRSCPPIANGVKPNAFATGYYVGSTFHVQSVWCPSGGSAAPDPTVLTDAVTKLLPAPPIRTAPPNGKTLVNFNNLFWIDSPPQQILRPTGDLLGASVTFRITFKELTVDFGDGDAGTVTELPEPYDIEHDCGPCADRFGHAYRTTGPQQVRATTSCTAEYSIDNGPWTTIGSVSSAPSTTTMTVYEAHSELVAPR